MGATLRWMQQAQPENHPSRAHPPLHQSPSSTTTTLPTPDPAATPSTPITAPPTAMTAEGIGLTGMPAPAYPAYPMRPTGGGIFFERTSVFERSLKSSNEDSNWKIVFALIAIQLNPIESKLLGRVAAKAQRQQRVHQIYRRLTQICARKTQICARKTQICARKKGFWLFQLICCIP